MGGRLSFPGGGHYHATKARAGATLRTACARAARLRLDVILLEPGRSRRFASGDGVAWQPHDRPATDPSESTRSRAVTKGAYDGPMKLLGGGPTAWAKRSSARTSAAHPAADQDHTVGQGHVARRPAADHWRLGRCDEQQFPEAGLDRRPIVAMRPPPTSNAMACRRRARAAAPVSPGRRRNRRRRCPNRTHEEDESLLKRADRERRGRRGVTRHVDLSGS